VESSEPAERTYLHLPLATYHSPLTTCLYLLEFLSLAPMIGVAGAQPGPATPVAQVAPRAPER